MFSREKLLFIREKLDQEMSSLRDLDDKALALLEAQAQGVCTDKLRDLDTELWLVFDIDEAEFQKFLQREEELLDSDM